MSQSSNRSFSELPTDAGKLTKREDNGKQVYEGESRRYELTPTGRDAGNVRITVHLEGTDLPETDTVQLERAQSRERFTKLLAGPDNPIAEECFKLDVRQITKEELTNQTMAGSGTGELIARFDGLVDLVLVDKESRFWVRSRTGTMRLQSTVTVQGQEYGPPPARLLPFLVPEHRDVKGNVDQRQLWSDVQAWILGRATPPGGTEDLLTAWVFHTHQMEIADHSPNIGLEGAIGHGKSRLGKALVYVARRGIVTEAINAAQLIRDANDKDATLFFDLYDANASFAKKDTYDIVLGRFSRGYKIPRILDVEAGPFRDTTYFDVFGPSIIASNTPLRQPLLSRCLPIQMPHAPDSDLPYPKEEAALPIRARLIGWRAQILGQTLPVPAHGLRGRLADISRPLLAITQAVCPERLDAVIAAIRAIDGQRQASAEDTREGRVIAAVIDLRNKVSGSLLPVSHITDMANDGWDARNQLIRQDVGNILKQLGLATKRHGQRNRAHLIWDEAQIDSLGLETLGRGLE